ncbi:glycosyltransferase family 4 protein [Aquincola sp. S2]|uniref:Glycosyltransferase family 4 protein n=1 Tax=Pseudaquabacterium terrae TaxID=2732868 RepID=A0ABX2EUE1_9BURK|nr:glycosyltransferase family 4 protein [Aquabacterium terrae]NRF72349.1 glycosyltransferase family 4 protein [Aquabacterium terrae]
MKVLHVTRESHEDRRYGMGRSIRQLMQGLAGHGVASDCFVAGDLSAAALSTAQLRASRWADAIGAEQAPLLEIVSRAWQAGQEAARQVKSGAFTHVHCHDAVVAHGYLSAADGLDVPMGLTLHAFDSMAFSLRNYVADIPPALAEGLDSIERQVLIESDWAVFLSQAGAKRMAAELDLGPPESRANWHVVPHGKPALEHIERSAARQQLGWTTPRRVLLAVGQLVANKRFDWVVEAMCGLDDRWDLVLLGEGDATSLQDLAARLGVRAPHFAVTDVPGPYYCAADAFTSASAIESFGMAHLEAMVAGLPIACTAVGGVPEVVGSAACLLAPEKHAYAQGLAEFLGDDAGLERAAAAARARQAAWPSVAEIAARHLAAYRRVERRRGGARLSAPMGIAT